MPPARYDKSNWLKFRPEKCKTEIRKQLLHTAQSSAALQRPLGFSKLFFLVYDRKTFNKTKRRFDMTATAELLALIETLEKEHSEVRDALDRIDSAVDAEDSDSLGQALSVGAPVLGEGLDSHSAAEDDRLFPALSEAMGEGIVGAFVGEHDEIRSLRDQVYESIDRGKADFGKSGEFSELLRSHIDREEAMLFPSAKDILSD